MSEKCFWHLDAAFIEGTKSGVSFIIRYNFRRKLYYVYLEDNVPSLYEEDILKTVVSGDVSVTIFKNKQSIEWH